MQKEQIVTISANETVTTDGDAILVVFYRTKIDSAIQTTSLENLEYHLVSSVQDWDNQYSSMKGMIREKNADIVALTHTARNLG